MFHAQSYKIIVVEYLKAFVFQTFFLTFVVQERYYNTKAGGI